VGRGARRAGVRATPSRAGLRAAASAGGSLVIRTLALQATLVVVTAIAARQGNAAIAANQVAFRIWNLLTLALDAIAIAGQAITGRHLGGGNVAAARAATSRMIAWGAAYGVAFGLAVVAVRPFLPGLFAVAPDVRRLLLEILLVVAVLQPASGVVFVLDGVLIGAGDQDYLALAGLATLAVFGVAVAALVPGRGLLALWAAFSAWMLARLVTLALRARSSRWLVTGAVRGLPAPR
jgi:Na+-driven multidrug efflux pump